MKNIVFFEEVKIIQFDSKFPWNYKNIFKIKSFRLKQVLNITKLLNILFTNFNLNKNPS